MNIPLFGVYVNVISKNVENKIEAAAYNKESSKFVLAYVKIIASPSLEKRPSSKHFPGYF